MSTQARRPLAPPLLPDVLGDQGGWINQSHPSGETAQTPQISEAAADHGEAPAVRDHAHQAADAHQVLLHHLLYNTLDGLYFEIAYVLRGRRLPAQGRRYAFGPTF